MKAQQRAIAMSLFIVGPFLTLSAIAGETPSVLSRVQTIDDPELAELIRVALEDSNLDDPQEPEAILKVVSAVTRKYAQIRLLDRQIEQLSDRIDQGTLEELRLELILARAELESKRIMELAELRQIMGVIPRHALGRKPVQQLQTWLKLDALNDQVVYVLEASRPFSSKDKSMKYNAVGLMSKKQVLEYVQQRLKQKDDLPIRIDIPRTVEGIELADTLRAELIAVVKKAGLEMEAEVHLDAAAPRWSPGRGGFDIEGKTIETLSPTANRYERVDRDAIGARVAEQLARPWCIPVAFRIRHDHVNRDLAEQVGKIVEDVAQRMGIAEFVEVTYLIINSKAQYIGKWQVVGKDLALTIWDNGQFRFEGEEEGQGRWQLDREGLSLAGHEGHLTSENELVLRLDDEDIVFKRVE